MRKIAKYKKGSSLVLILIVMSVLMILGTAMLSLAFSSYKFRAIEQNKKTSLYASEAGIDEAYEIMGEFVNYGIKQGDKAVEEYDKNFESLIKVERYKVENGTASSYIDKGGNITSSTVEADRKRVFEEGYKVKTIQYMEDDETLDVECYDKGGSIKEKGYKEFIETGLSSGQGVFKEDDKLSQGGMNNLMEQLNVYPYEINKALGDKNENIKINATKVTERFINDKPVIISIESSYKHKSIPRIVKATYEINVAKHNVQYNLLPTQIVKIPKNPVWSKSLMVNGEMKINGGNVVIGNEDNLNDPNNTGIYVAAEQGGKIGIDLNGYNSTLKLIGNLVTNKDLKVSYNNSNNVSENKNVEVSGNIYGRNIIIDNNVLTDSDGNPIEKQEKKIGKVNVKELDKTRNGSVYLMDDLEINGENSTVDIAGSYYGISDGSKGEKNKPDQSSSIIINAEDISNKKEVVKDDNTNESKEVIIPNTNTSKLNISKNVYIAGTSYIDLFNDIKYQTGESISIKGNYRAYTETLPNSKYKEENVIFDYLDPLTLVTKHNKNENAMLRNVKAILEENKSVTVNLTKIGELDEKCKNAVNYKILYNGRGSEITSIGSSVKHDLLIDSLNSKYNAPIIEVELYTLDNKLISKESNISLISFDEMLYFNKSEYFQEYCKQFPNDNGLNLGEGISINTNIENIYVGNIFTAQNRDNPVVTGNWSIPLDMKIKARSIQLKNQLFYMGLAKDYVALSSTTNIDAIDDSTVIADSEYNSIDDKTEPVVTIKNNVDFGGLTKKCEDKGGDVFILENDINSTHVLGDGASNVPGNFPVSNLKGIIITNGNIIISGNLNFKGTIICNGDLTFEGTGEKKITYDKAYLENLILNNHVIFKDVFKDVGQYAKDNASNYLFAKVYNNSVNTGNIDDKFKLIKRTKWQLIK